MSTIQVAIDGPAGSGKSTVAHRVAEVLGALHLDSGSLYRALSLYVLRRGKNPAEPAAVAQLCEDVLLYMRQSKDMQRVFVGDEDVSDVIRTSEVGKAASQVSQVPQARARVNEIIRSIAAQNDVVIDGRDIGTVVLPEAAYKFFLTATATERARRRSQDLAAQNLPHDVEEIEKEILARDVTDMTRAIDPLRKAEDAIEIDTTELSADEVAERIVQRIHQDRQTVR